MDVRVAVLDRERRKARLYANGRLEKAVMKLNERYLLKCKHMLNGADLVVITVRDDNQNEKKHVLKVSFDRVDHSEREFCCVHAIVRAYPILSD